MCANYTPGRSERMQEIYPQVQWPMASDEEVFPGAMAPIVFAQAALGDGRDVLSAQLAMFGMVPPWADVTLARHTYNARSETVASKPSFRNAWQRRQFCLIGMQDFFEPRYDSGSAERWRLRHAEHEILWLAGIWERKAVQRQADQADLFSFSMLTINADEHPLMQKFHKAGEEKRMPVLLSESMRQAWLQAENPLAILQAAQQWPAGFLHAEPAPLPKRARTAKATSSAQQGTPDTPQQASLF